MKPSKQNRRIKPPFIKQNQVESSPPPFLNPPLFSHLANSFARSFHFERAVRSGAQVGLGFEHIGVNKLALKTREGEQHLNISWSAVQTQRKEQYKMNGFDQFECTVRRSDQGRRRAFARKTSDFIPTTTRGRPLLWTAHALGEGQYVNEFLEG